jgi:hypothetical protein
MQEWFTLLTSDRKCAYKKEKLTQQNLESINQQLNSLRTSVNETKGKMSDLRNQAVAGTAAVQTEVEKSSKQTSRELQLIRNSAASMASILCMIASLPDLVYKT